MLLRSVLIAAALPLLVGCLTPPPIPQDSFYRFVDPAPISAAKAPALQARLFVERPQAIGERRGRALLYAYADEPMRLRKYHVHLWEEAPAKMLQRRLVSALRDSGVAAAVGTDHRRPDDYLLRSELVRFEQVRGDGAPVAVLALDILLRQGLQGELLRRRYEQQVPAQSNEMTATIEAFEHAVDAAIAELIEDLQQSGATMSNQG